jgi:hypothetical protein
MKLLVPLVVLLSSCLFKAQTAPGNAPKQPPLATVTAHLEKTVYKSGEPIQVTLTLRAGPRWAYVSKWSRISPNDEQNSSVGRYIGNISGFDVSLLTLDGKNAETIGHGGVADRFDPAPVVPSERFKEEFLFLKPGEEESWRGNIEGTPVKPGRYQIVGVYMADYNQVHELAGLPEARGLLIVNVVRSAPIIITIE